MSNMLGKGRFETCPYNKYHSYMLLFLLVRFVQFDV